MNSLQNLFNIDERITPRTRRKEITTTLLYCVFDPRQWKYIRRWRRSIMSGATPYKDELPWVTYRAIDFLSLFLQKDHKVFEYGSGGSTIYFADRVAEVVSIEHDTSWYALLLNELKEKGKSNVKYLLKRPAKLHGKHTKHEYFRSLREKGVSFEEYVTSINQFRDNYFDLVSVDGRSRVACVREAFDKVKNGGYILLDNSERRDYFEAHLYMRSLGCEQIDLFGLVGYETILSQTTLWHVRK